MKKYQEDDLVICKVTNIVKTTVFVETLEGKKGSIVMSEVAPGRIRNIRAYVVPNKIIVCKILDMKDDHLFLSLRRVKENEKRDLINNYKKEKTFLSVLKKLLGEKYEETVEKITKDQTLADFIEEAKADSKILDKYFKKEDIENLKKVFQDKEKKQKEIKKEFKLSCKAPDGVIVIKNMLKEYQGISYLGNSKFVIKRTSNDLKKLDAEINQNIENIEKDSKKNKCDFQLLRTK